MYCNNQSKTTDIVKRDHKNNNNGKMGGYEKEILTIEGVYVEGERVIRRRVYTV